MQKIKTEWNPLYNKTETYYWDEATQTVHIKNTYNVSDVIEQNKRSLANNIDARYGKEMLQHVAEIPNVFIAKLLKEHNIDVFSNEPEQRKRLRRLLDDPEYRFLKTTNKRLWRPKGG